MYSVFTFTKSVQDLLNYWQSACVHGIYVCIVVYVRKSITHYFYLFYSDCVIPNIIQLTAEY